MWLVVSWFGNCLTWFTVSLSCLINNKQAYERSEDPIYVLENNIPIDPEYYLENQIKKVSFEFENLLFCRLGFTTITSFVTSNQILSLSMKFYDDTVHLQPLLRIFEPILKNASKELLQGSHTRSKSVLTPTGGIMKYAQKRPSCIGCKMLIE